MFYAANGPDFDARMIAWWKHGWENFAKTRVPAHIAGVERATSLRVYGIQIHHPWGRQILDGKPAAMEFNQLEQCSLVADVTDHPILHNALDTNAFVRAMSTLSKQKRVMIYLGSPFQQTRLPQEPINAWVTRAKAAIDPILRIEPPCAIGFDNTYGQPARSTPKTDFGYLGGSEGAVAALVRDLDDKGHEIFFEGGILFNAQWARAICSTYTTEHFFPTVTAGKAHYLKGWGRWAKPGRETRGTSLVQIASKGTDEEKLYRIEQWLDAGYDVALQPSELPYYPWQ